MSKTWLFGAAAILTAILPGAAAAQSGHVGASYNHGTLHIFGSHGDYDGWSADGVAAFDLGGGWGSQVGVTYTDNSFSSGGGDLKDWGIDGHIYHRDSNWQWGGALAYNSNQGFSSSDINSWSAAGEARWFMPNSSLGASLSYSNSDSSGSSAHSWRLGGDARFFVTDNFEIGGGLGYENLSGSGSSANGWDANIGAEWQFSSVPISIYGGYGRNTLSTSGPDLTVDAFTLGARWNFGGGSLRERDQTGANLDHLSGPYERAFFGH